VAIRAGRRFSRYWLQQWLRSFKILEKPVRRNDWGKVLISKKVKYCTGWKNFKGIVRFDKTGKILICNEEIDLKLICFDFFLKNGVLFAGKFQL